MIISEDSQLYKGIFWIPDEDNLDDNQLYFQVPCTSDGNIELDIDLNSKSGKSFNHERTWNSLPRNLTGGHKYNYYPRGRVEIARGKATIYCSPHICTDKVKSWLINKYNLTNLNGINNVVISADGSAHYKCYLDE